MAIQPLDLQVMFNQLDTVGKTQASLREGLAIQQTLQGMHAQEKTSENIQAVNESQNTGDGMERVKDRGSRRQPGKQYGKQEQKEEDTKKSQNLWDPQLGKNVDMSG